MLTNFLKEETGAVTVDWVVLTAALVGLGIAVMAVVSGGVEDISDEMGQTLTDTSVEFTYFNSGGSSGDTGLSILDEGAIHNRHSGDWMDNTVAGWSDPNNISDENLSQLYAESAAFVANQQANGVTNQQEYETRLDYMGATEAAMSNRGMDRPAADTDYTTALTNFRNG